MDGCGPLLAFIRPLEHYSIHWLQHWVIIPAIDTNNGALFLPMTPTMGCYFFH
ncbi:unnamed protein product [Staurois parvus]|uniref:Uncharacterized protein n=1 Tax=Staurois parvus TaxID=386267 RepID=A0ABN9D4I9_9NEOB|nr:unnamed protein product [Staurois parvus]